MRRYLRQPGAKRYLGWSLRGLAMVTGLVSAIGLVYLPSLSQPTLRAKIVEIAGQPDHTAVIVEGVAAKSGNEIISGQHVTTPGKAKVSFQLTNALRERSPQSSSPTTEKSPQAAPPTRPNAGFRLGQQSSFVLDNECVQLESGRTVVAGMQGCIGTIVIDTNTGIYTLERLGYLTEIKVLSGQVQIEIPSNPGIQSIVLKASQKITIDLTGDEIGPIRRMLPTEVQSIITGELFQGFQVPLPQQDTIAGLKPKPTAVVPVTKPPAPAPTIVAEPVATLAEPVQPQPEVAATTTSDHENEIAAIRDRNIAAARRRRFPASNDYAPRRSLPPHAWVSSRRQRPSSYEPPAYNPPVAEPPAAPVAEPPVPTPSANIPPTVSEPPAPVTPPIAQPPMEPPTGGGEPSGPPPAPIEPPSGGNAPESPVVVPGV